MTFKMKQVGHYCWNMVGQSVENERNISSLPRNVEESVANLGLDLQAIRNHQANLVSFLKAGQPRYFPIVDTCRIDNGGIVRLPVRSGGAPGMEIPVVAFIPAAGASSRYLQVFVPLMNALSKNDYAAVKTAIDALKSEGVLHCPIPSSLKDLVELLKQPINAIPASVAAHVLAELESPKALYPAVVEGDTFLELKRAEHQGIGGFAGELYICPPRRVDEFMRVGGRAASPWKMQCLEQGAEFATVRFRENGEIALTEEGLPSTVPAGHGSLLKMMPRVQEIFPGSRGIFIRNIDNIAGTGQDVLSATKTFLAAFRWTLSQIDKIRTSFINRERSACVNCAQEVLEYWGLNPRLEIDPLKDMLLRLFHVDSPEQSDRVAKLLARPLVLMGQVPNTSRDVGGTCVFTEIEGHRQKLCLEVPHASPADKKTFLENPSKATHFNPVFVAAEIPSTEALAQWDGHPFWLIAKKSWRGHEVFYQESILYEMLGSSQYCNVLFVEVPRVLFNPHKSLADATNKKRASWIVD